MKLTLSLTGMTFVLCAGSWAQTAPADTGAERVVVPARNSTRPRKVDVNLMSGAITIKAYAGKDVIVEANPASSSHRKTNEKENARDAAARAEGLDRLDAAMR